MSSDPVVLALDFGGSKIAAAVADLQGVRLGTATIAARGHEGAGTTFARSLHAARALLADAAPERELVAVGACTFGIPFEDRVELAPTIAGWGALPFGRLLRESFGVPIRYATDVKAAAMAEVRWGALAGCDPAVYLNLGTGLAAAIVANGQVVTGRHGAAGEIAYNVRAPADVALALGQRPLLEDLVSGKALAYEASRLLGRPATAEDVLAATDESQLAEIRNRFLDDLCFHVANLAIAIDPERIAVGGGMIRSWEALEAPLRRALERACPFPPELVLAKFPHDAPLIGAVALAVEAAELLVGNDA
jgi:glucokinase